MTDAPAPAHEDGLIGAFLARYFGRSYRTTIAGLGALLGALALGQRVVLLAIIFIERRLALLGKGRRDRRQHQAQRNREHQGGAHHHSPLAQPVNQGACLVG
jgi:hypothetical protein